MIHRGPLSQNKLVFLRYFLWMGENIHSAESGWGLFTAVAEAAIICMMGFSTAVFSVPQGGTQWHTAYPYMVQHVTVCSPLSLPAAPVKSAMTQVLLKCSVGSGQSAKWLFRFYLKCPSLKSSTLCSEGRHFYTLGYNSK